MLTTINQLLVMTAREQAGREGSPTAGVIDSQSVKTTESGGISGYDAGKKVKGRKRHIITDTWLGRCRLAKGRERSIESSTAWATIASIRLLTRRIVSLSNH